MKKATKRSRRKKLEKEAEKMIFDWFETSPLASTHSISTVFWIAGFPISISENKTRYIKFFSVEESKHNYKYAILQLIRQIEEAYAEEMVMATLKSEILK